MISLGLDPSLRGFGYCIHNSSVAGAERVIEKGVFSTPPKKHFVWRYMYLQAKLGEVLDGHPEVEITGVESPPFGEQYSEGLYGLFIYVNQVLFVRRRDVVYFDPMRVKALARIDPKIRKGSMDKTDMQDAARSETGIKKFNHNEADAYVIARSTARFWEFYLGVLKEDELLPSETAIFKKLILRENDRFHRYSKLTDDDVDLKGV